MGILGNIKTIVKRKTPGEHGSGIWAHIISHERARGLFNTLCILKKNMGSWGAWVAQSVERPTSAQVMVSQFMGSSPTLGSLLSAQSLLWILCLSLSVPKINKNVEKKIKKKKEYG